MYLRYLIKARVCVLEYPVKLDYTLLKFPFAYSLISHRFSFLLLNRMNCMYTYDPCRLKDGGSISHFRNNFLNTVETPKDKKRQPQTKRFGHSLKR